MLELCDSRDRLNVLSMPFNAPRRQLFNRLREGDSVHIKGCIGDDRFELEIFRSQLKAFAPR